MYGNLLVKCERYERGLAYSVPSIGTLDCCHRAKGPFAHWQQHLRRCIRNSRLQPLYHRLGRVSGTSALQLSTWSLAWY